MNKMLKLMVVVAAIAAIWFLKYAGVTHEDIYSAVTDESAEIQSVAE